MIVINFLNGWRILQELAAVYHGRLFNRESENGDVTYIVVTADERIKFLSVKHYNASLLK